MRTVTYMWSNLSADNCMQLKTHNIFLLSKEKYLCHMRLLTNMSINFDIKCIKFSDELVIKTAGLFLERKNIQATEYIFRREARIHESKRANISKKNFL